MRILHSVVEEGYVKEIVAKRYRLSGEVECRFFCKGQNDTYRVTCAGGTYFFRIYRNGFRARSEICAELRMLNLLHSSGLEIGRPIIRFKDSYLNCFNTPEGQRYGVLFKGVNGRLENRPDLATAGELGVLLAKMHACLEGVEISRPRLNVREVFQEAVEIIRLYGGRNKALHSLMQGIGGDLERILGKLPQAGSGWGLCHGDYYLGNIRIDRENGSFGVFDFDCCLYTWRAYDLACFLVSLFVNVGTPRGIQVRWRSFLTGYQTAKRIERKDLDMIPTLGLLRIIWIMTLHSKNAVRDKGIFMMDHAYFDKGIKLLTAWNRAFGLRF